MTREGDMPSAGAKFIADRTPDHLDGDPFRVGPVAERIAAILRAIEPPFTVSLSGSWGVGKTSLVEEVERRLPNARIVLVDVWIEDLIHLRRKIAVELGAAISDDRSPAALDKAREDTADSLDKAMRVSKTDDLDPEMSFGAFRRLLPRAEAAPFRTLAFVYGAGIFLLVTMAAVLGQWAIAPVLMAVLTALAVFLVVGSGQVVTVRTSKQSTAPATEALTLATELRALTRRPVSGGETVLLIVDNLDRLQGKDAMSVLSDIRAFVDDRQSRCVFLIPIDRDAFARSVEQLIGTSQAARDFLEKFFNLDIVLTRPAALELRAWTRGLLEAAFPEHDAKDRTAAAVLIAAAAAGSPRAAKRMVNGVSARFWLIDERLRGGYTLAQLAVLEALIAQFPAATSVVARDARILVEAREALRAATDASSRSSALGPLDEVGLRAVALREFLVVAEAVPLGFDDITTVLSLRDDPSMQGVPDAAAVRDALRSGQPDILGSAIAGFGEPERALALQRGVDLARADADAGFHPSAVAVANALASHVDDPDLRSDLRVIAAEALVQVDPTTYRTLPQDTVSLVFAAGPEDRRLPRIADSAADELAARPTLEPRIGLVRVVAAGARLLREDNLAAVTKGLAALPDADLAPLFEPSAVPELIAGEVANALVNRLATWSAAIPAAEVAIVAERLIAVVEEGIIPAAHLDPIATGLAQQLPASAVESVTAVESIVEVLAHADPGPNVDTLAQALATWATDRDIGLRLACKLPFQNAVNAQIADAGVALATTQPPTVIQGNFAETRAVLRRVGADLQSPLARRWVGGEGPEFLDLVLADPGTEAWEAVSAQLAAVTINTFPALFAEAATRTVGAGATGAPLETLRDAFVGRAGEMTPSQISESSQGLAALAGAGGDPAPAGEAVAARIGAMTASEAAAWTASAQAVGTAVPGLAAGLAQSVAARSRALGTIDLERVPWLLSHSADREQVKDAVVSEVANDRRSPAELAAGLDGIRGPLRGVWVVRRAIVFRARAIGSSSDPEPLLAQAGKWNPVPPGEGVDYNAALDEILSFGDFTQLVGDLRG